MLAVLLLLGACASTAPAVTQARPSRAREAISRGDVATADLELKLAIQADPLDAESHHMLACLLAQRGESEQALVGFQRAAALDPTDSEAAYNVGTLLLRRGEPVAAARWLETAATLRPGVPSTYNNLAKAYFVAGLPELSYATYEESLRHDPTNAVALRGMTTIARAAGLDDGTATRREGLEQTGDYVSRSMAPGAAMPPAPENAGVPTEPVPGSDPDAEGLRALLAESANVRVERRGGRLTVSGWTIGEKERGRLTRVLAEWPEVLDLTSDDTGDPRRMVEVDATIFVVIEIDSSSVGFNFLRNLNTTFSYFATDHRRDGTGFTAPRATGSVDAGYQQGWMLTASVDYDVNIANAAEERVAVLARPHLTTLSGTPAKFLAGGEFVFRVAGNISGDIKPYPFGTTLIVTPTLLREPTADGTPRIHLQVEAGRTSVLALLTATGDSDSTVFDKVEVSSEAVLGVGETLIVSGLSQRERRESQSGVPILRDIPLVKYLFSSTTMAETNTAVVILLTPRDPGYHDDRNREAIARFVEKRKAYVEARMGGDEALRRYMERYPDWADMAPNRFATHFFLMRNSELYRAASGQDLTTESLDFDLLGSRRDPGR